MMARLLAKIRQLPAGGWLLITMGLTVLAGLGLGDHGEKIAAVIRAQHIPVVHELLDRAETAAPQAFFAARSVEEAEDLRAALNVAGQTVGKRDDGLAVARGWHYRDLLFMAAYTAFGLAAAWWLCERGREAAELRPEPRSSARGRWLNAFNVGLWLLRWLRWLLAKVAEWGGWWMTVVVLVAVGADLWEYSLCQRALQSVGSTPAGVIDPALLSHAGQAFKIKTAMITIAGCGWLLAVVLSFAIPKRRKALQETWELLARGHRFAMRARFVVLAGVVFTFLMLSGPGLDIIRLLAAGTFDTELAVVAGAGTQEKITPPPDFARLGWFAVGLLMLSAACWGWTRLVLAFNFSAPAQRAPELPARIRGVEERLRRDLPLYYASLPFAVAAGALAVAPLTEVSDSTPTAQFFAAALMPVVVFILLPWLLVVLRADTRAAPRPAAPSGWRRWLLILLHWDRRAVNDPESNRGDFGPLAWTLLTYAVLALVHALFHWTDLRVFGFVPLVLLMVALCVFALGVPKWFYVLPGLLFLSAWVHGELSLSLLLPTATLVLLGWASCRMQRQAKGVDELHVGKVIATTDLVRGIVAPEVLERAVQPSVAPKADAPVASDADAAREKEKEQDAAAQLNSLVKLGALLVFMQCAVFLAVLIWPQPFPLAVGAGALVAAGLAAWATFGSLLILCTRATRFPLVAVTLVFAVLCSLLMDNHKVRLSHRPDGEFAPGKFVKNASAPKDDALAKDALPLRAKLDAWAAQLPDAKSPCVLVATEGGGIRAAFLTGAALATLQDASNRVRGQKPDFAAHVFGISGISGGSVGAAFFAALCAEPEARASKGSGGMRGQAARLLGADHLAPGVAALFYPDLIQRFLPKDFEFLPDRAEALEKSWERAWAGEFPQGPNRMAAPFLDLWKGQQAQWVPQLFMTGTMVEDGRRVIASETAITTDAGGEFLNAHDLHAHLREVGPTAGEWRDVPLSTAAHTSARFPLVSPPGRLPSGRRVMDGGYFEVSGVPVCLDLLAAVRAHEKLRTRPVVILILRFGGEPAWTEHLAERPVPTRLVPADAQGPYQPKHLLNETESLILPVVRARDARARDALSAALHQRGLSDGNVDIISLNFHGDEVPLSWALSARASDILLKQLPADFLDPQTTRTNTPDRQNLQAARELFGWIDRTPPSRPATDP